MEFAQVLDKLSEQPWFQELKSKWEELDPQSRLYLSITAAGMATLTVLLIVLSFISSVHKLKDEVNDKSEILSMIQSASDELRRLKDTSGNMSGAESNEPWPPYFENLANGAGIPKEGFNVSEAKPGASSEVAKEALFDLAVKHVSIRQVVRLAQSLESGARPVKLRDLTIDTIPDGTGYLDATLSVSAFGLVPQPK